MAERKTRPLKRERSAGSPSIHLNLRVRGMRPSATVASQARCSYLAKKGREVFRMGLGQSPFPVPDCVVERLREHAPEKDYLPVRGLPALREAIAEHHRAYYGIDCGAADVIVGPGSKELMFLLQLVYYGDIVIPTPCWVSYEPQARIIGRRVHRLPTLRDNKFKLVPEQIDALCRDDPSRPRLLILNYPNNPGGGTYGPQELKAIAEAARRYDVLLLSDEIYGKLNFFGNHASLAPFYPEGTIVSGGLSKWCGAGGWRLGFFIVPAGMSWLLDAMAAAASETFTATCAPIQYAAVRAFEMGDEIEIYLERCRAILKALGRLAAARLRGAGAEVEDPLGAFYLFPDLTALGPRLAERGIRTSDELCRRLLDETGVAMLPGTEFGREPQELTVRLAYVDFDGRAALEAYAGLPEDRPVAQAFLAERCARVLEAVDRFCAWLAK